MRGRLGRGEDGALFLYQSQGQERSQRWGSAGPSSHFSSAGRSSAWKGSERSPPSPLRVSGSQQLPLLQDLTPTQSFLCPLQRPPWRHVAPPPSSPPQQTPFSLSLLFSHSGAAPEGRGSQDQATPRAGELSISGWGQVSAFAQTPELLARAVRLGAGSSAGEHVRRQRPGPRSRPTELPRAVRRWFVCSEAGEAPPS